MSNPNAPFGFRPVRWPGAVPRLRRYQVLAATNTGVNGHIARGDLVSAQADGSVIRSAAGDATIVGAVVHVEYIDSVYMLRRGTYLPTATDGYVYVAAEPGITYIGMSGGAATDSVTTDELACCDHTDGTPVHTTEWGGHSIQKLNTASLSNTTASFRLEQPWGAVDNLFGTGNTYGVWECVLIENINGPTAASGGQAAGVTS